MDLQYHLEQSTGLGQEKRLDRQHHDQNNLHYRRYVLKCSQNYAHSILIISFYISASFLPATCFIGVCLAGCNRIMAVTLMSLGAMFMAGKYCGFLSNHIDIAPNYAGTLMGLTNTVATIPGFVVPFVVGELTHGNVLKFEV